MFDRPNGVNVAEFELPTYFNFFVKRKQIKILTTAVVEKRILRVFRETLLGPKAYKIQEDFPEDTPSGAFPNFKTEGEALDNFRKDMTVQKMVSFEPFTAKGKDEAVIDFGAAEEDADRNVRIIVNERRFFRNDEPNVGGFRIEEDTERYFEITDKKVSQCESRQRDVKNDEDLLTPCCRLLLSASQRFGLHHSRPVLFLHTRK